MDQLAGEGVNLSFIEELYKTFKKDPTLVNPSWRSYFASLAKEVSSEKQLVDRRKKIDEVPHSQGIDPRIIALVNDYRWHGHLAASIDPLAKEERVFPQKFEFSPEEMDNSFDVKGLMNSSPRTLREINDHFHHLYCGSVGIEYKGRGSEALQTFIEEKIERGALEAPLSPDDKHFILKELNRSALFESFLQTKFVGQKRFSLEGGETVIPLLKSLIEFQGSLGVEEFIMGMAHRGRLNVLANILEKSYRMIFSEFEDAVDETQFTGSGDVKYHKGFSSVIKLSSGKEISISLAPNASHLESVYPIVEGKVRGKQEARGDKQKVKGVIIHGDASLTGQGVVYETMQFNALPGYTTGGTVHIVINNQIGFTTRPEEGRSTLYCTDIAATFGAPVFHVNGEDPEAAVQVARLASEIVLEFGVDVFIDLVCYRKYGHNETDEPQFTQPKEYQIIGEKQSIREIYRDKLLKEGSVEQEMASQLEQDFKSEMAQALEKKEEILKESQKKERDVPPFHKNHVQTAVSKKTIKEVGKKMVEVPKGFRPHKKIEKLLQERDKMAQGEKPIDWGMGEMLAYATLLAEGTHVRIAGQDVCRGTFTHRHAVLIDQEDGEPFVPLEQIGFFQIFNSPLSEFASLGFEYGYSTSYPAALVVWEAQFGDFANGAQIIFDQYLSPGEQKWGQTSNLVIFLPHGYEGQGPEHSSGRIERLLTLAGEDNMILVQPTTPAQHFHLLRKHMHSMSRVPLIVMTPKGLLRHPICVSSVNDLTKGAFQPIIDDIDRLKSASQVALCSGRIYYDLLEEREKRKSSLPLIRLEQLYPLNSDLLKEVLGRYKGLKEILWVQAEPENMGAWHFVKDEFEKHFSQEIPLKYVGREESASPATGSHKKHEAQEELLMDNVFGKKQGEGR